jgi:hypothetical protein
MSGRWRPKARCPAGRYSAHYGERGLSADPAGSSRTAWRAQDRPQRAGRAMTAQPSGPVSDSDSHDVIHLGGEAAVVVPMAEYRRLVTWGSERGLDVEEPRLAGRPVGADQRAPFGGGPRWRGPGCAPARACETDKSEYAADTDSPPAPTTSRVPSAEPQGQPGQTRHRHRRRLRPGHEHASEPVATVEKKWARRHGSSALGLAAYMNCMTARRTRRSAANRSSSPVRVWMNSSTRCPWWRMVSRGHLSVCPPGSVSVYV